MTFSRLLVVVGVLICCEDCWAQPVPRPDPFEPGYQHNRWNTQPTDIVRRFRAYTTNFDGPDDDDGDGTKDLWGIPEWVSYELRAGPDRSEFESRPNAWLSEPNLFQQAIAPADASYLHSPYSRGHMCMRQHARRLGRNADWNTHTTLNACPQIQAFNGGYWLSLETLCSLWANLYGKVWIICGPIVARDGSLVVQEWTGDSGEVPVAVPEQFFKIVVKNSGVANRPDVIAFIYDHDPSLISSGVDVDHTSYLRSVREIEGLTGLNFFSSLPSADQEVIESERAVEVWPHKLAPAPTPERRSLKRLDILPTADARDLERLFKAETDAEVAVEGGATIPPVPPGPTATCGNSTCVAKSCRRWRRRCR